MIAYFRSVDEINVNYCHIFEIGPAGLEHPAGARNRRKATAKILFLSMIPILQSCRKNRRKRYLKKSDVIVRHFYKVHRFDSHTEKNLIIFLMSIPVTARIVKV